MVKEKVCEGKADGHRGREGERDRCPGKGCIYDACSGPAVRGTQRPDEIARSFTADSGVKISKEMCNLSGGGYSVDTFFRMLRTRRLTFLARSTSPSKTPPQPTKRYPTPLSSCYGGGPVQVPNTLSPAIANKLSPALSPAAAAASSPYGGPRLPRRFARCVSSVYFLRHWVKPLILGQTGVRQKGGLPVALSVHLVHCFCIE